ncbi:MAG: DUF4145 domain-containing protein [Clostridiaceae bacterium]
MKEVTIRGSKVKVEIPKTCPHCHEINTPNIVSDHTSVHFPFDSLGLLMQCSSCSQYFALAFNLYDGQRTHLIEFTYLPNIKYDMPDELDEISPLFREIYSQSQVAESMELYHVAGVGYRKAIEFLVKDYLIFKDSDKEQHIKTLHLSNAINKISSEQIKDLALAATWIGNDETHYLRKIEGKTLEHMKKFLKVLAYSVSSDVIAYEAKKLIKDNSTISSK